MKTKLKPPNRRERTFIERTFKQLKRHRFGMDIARAVNYHLDKVVIPEYRMPRKPKVEEVKPAALPPLWLIDLADQSVRENWSKAKWGREVYGPEVC